MEPRVLPRFPAGPQELRPPWRWWRHKLRPCPDGAMFHQETWGADMPTGGPIERYSIHFDLLNMYEIINPPSMFLTTTTPEYETIYGIDRELMTRGETVECDVVWYERPGELWHELPGNTCRPGEYEIRMVDRRSRDYNTVSTARRYESEMPPLYWRSTTLERLGEDALTVGENAVRAVAAAYGIPGPMVGAAFGDPSRVPATAMPGPRLEDQLSQIMDAIRQYQGTRRQRPTTVIMNQEDWELLRRDVMRDQELDWLLDGLYARAESRMTCDSIFGLQIRAERNMPRGRILVVGDTDFAGQMPAPIMPPTLFDGMVTPHPMSPSKSPVLPEAELVDEIDRLVNEQVRVGPVDDYNVDRYPKCPHCNHSWHGILCNECDCLGELEEEV